MGFGVGIVVPRRGALHGARDAPAHANVRAGNETVEDR